MPVMVMVLEEEVDVGVSRAAGMVGVFTGVGVACPLQLYKKKINRPKIKRNKLNSGDNFIK